MKAYIERRVILESEYVIETGATVRKTAKKFGVSKSTAHKDLTSRIQEINPSMAKDVAKVLLNNLEVRHIRGGEATKNKYVMKQKCKEIVN